MRWRSMGCGLFLSITVAACAPRPGLEACQTVEDGACPTEAVDPPDDPTLPLDPPQSACPGTCAAPVPDWEGPYHLITSPASPSSPATPLSCPAQSPVLHTALFADFLAPDAPHVCPVCTCAPSETNCTPPIEWHASTEEAPGDAGILTAFDAPPGWDGSCTSDNAIPPGALCEGVPCVRSVAVSAPQMNAPPCTATPLGRESKPSAAWGTLAATCIVNPLAGQCDTADEICAPELPGVETCVQRAGKHPCPPDYSIPRTFHDGAADTRACAPCTCGPPEDGSCTAIALAYSDPACAAAVGAKTIEANTPPQGFDVPSGTALGSKAAQVIATPGACPPSGGEPTGTLTPGDPVTVCCRPGIDARSK